MPDDGASRLGTSPDSRTLAGVDDREAAVARLTRAFEQDRLSADEFETRVARVYEAATRGELDSLISDLPGGSSDVALRGASALPVVPPEQISSILGNTEHRITDLAPNELDVRSILGNTVVMLQEARFVDGVTEIEVRSILGNVEVHLPPHVRVEQRIRSFMGSVADRSLRSGTSPDAPLVRLVGKAILGNVELY